MKTRLEMLLAAAVQATSLAASCMTGEWALTGEDAEQNRRAEGAAAHAALLAALAEYSYVVCDACGTPTPQPHTRKRRLADGSVVPTRSPRTRG